MEKYEESKATIFTSMSYHVTAKQHREVCVLQDIAIDKWNETFVIMLLWLPESNNSVSDPCLFSVRHIYALWTRVSQLGLQPTITLNIFHDYFQFIQWYTISDVFKLLVLSNL